MIADLDFAPFSILAFLAATLAVVACFLIIAHAALRGHRRRARNLLMILGIGLALYVAALLGASLFSKEHVLARGVEKYFCEVDCHLAYSVTGVRRAKILGGQTASGNYYVVTLRTRFDEATISRSRGNGLLTPNPRAVFVLDAEGRSYQPLSGDHAAMKAAAEDTRPLTEALRPGESYITRVVFDLPDDLGTPAKCEFKLFLKNIFWPNCLLIGHENSPLHSKAYFHLLPIEEVASSVN